MVKKIFSKSKLISSIAVLLGINTITFAHGQGTGTVNQAFVVSGCAGQHAYKIATLAESTDGTYDVLHLTVTLSSAWISATDTTFDATFANRGGFRGTYTAIGANPVGSGVHMVAYQNPSDGQSDDGEGTVDIYIAFNASACAVGSYAVLQSVQETVYFSPTDLNSATPPGTLIFDTAQAQYPPTNFADFFGNFAVTGQLHASGGMLFPNGALTPSGSVGIGTTTPGAPLEVNGNIKFTATPISPGSTTTTGGSLIFGDGTIQSTAYTGTCVATGGDYAESVDVTGERTENEPGDVIVVDPKRPGHFLLSAEPYSTLVAGIYSTKPGYVGRRQGGSPKMASGEIPMAMVGIVPTKVSTENGPVHTGDLLVAASKPGYAMKGTDRLRMTGAILGKALGDLDSGIGVVEVLVSLQ